jgi:hypothetical protein
MGTVEHWESYVTPAFGCACTDGPTGVSLAVKRDVTYGSIPVLCASSR